MAIMATVRLTMFRTGLRWNLEVQDARGCRFIGATAGRSQIEALALRLMEEAEAKGDDADLIVAPGYCGAGGGLLQGFFRRAG
jgi:hypothetical protein